MSTARIKLIEEKTFLGVDAYGHATLISTSDGPGVSPMQMLLMGVGGCTAIDVVDILRNQRQPLEGLRDPGHWRPRRGIPQALERHAHPLHLLRRRPRSPQGQRAIELSVEKYCGAHATVAGTATMSHDFEIQPGAAGATNAMPVTYGNA